MVRLLSFIYPITKKVKSEFNGTLEITWYNGKKHLNTKNANYSYGSLQKILKTGLQKINLSNCNNVLILGFGGGSVIKTLRKDFSYQNTITAIEIDPVVIKIAKEEFNVSKFNNLEIVCDDAFKFAEKNDRQFDLIIVDLFIDTEIPSSFYQISFWENIIKACSSKSSILFNASLDSKNDHEIVNIASFLFKNKFQIERLDKVNNTNTLLIAKR